MSDNTFHNPLLDDDDEDEFGPAAYQDQREQAQGPSQAHASEVPVAVNADVKISQPRRKGSPRARITDIDAKILAHCAQWPGCTVDAISVLHRTAQNEVSNGDLMTVGGAQRRLAKLEKLGVIEQDRALDGAIVWGTTPAGVIAARHHGYAIDEHSVTRDGFRRMSYEQLDHYRYIGLVAAMLKSEGRFYEDDLKLPPVPWRSLISEPQMRRDQEPIASQLRDIARAKGLNARDNKNMFGAWRREKLTEAIKLVNEGKLPISQLVARFPFFRTLGEPVKMTEGVVELAAVKGTHFPDLVIDRERERTTARSSSVAVEIELSSKSEENLGAILRTYAAEFEHSAVYGRVIYFVINDKIKEDIEDIDKFQELKLIERGLLTIVPIRDRFKHTAKLKKTVGDRKPPARPVLRSAQAFQAAGAPRP